MIYATRDIQCENMQFFKNICDYFNLSYIYPKYENQY
jgi:hypothetical protein